MKKKTTNSRAANAGSAFLPFVERIETPVLTAGRAIGVAKPTLAVAIGIARGLLSQFLNSLPFRLGSALLLLFYKGVENCIAVICVDGQDLPPVTDDHKIQVRTAGRKRTRAVRIYGVGARNIHWQD